eukprot:scaffold3484_cov110-Pinguiococcus_pyrenoidosus.AAC.1
MRQLEVEAKDLKESIFKTQLHLLAGRISAADYAIPDSTPAAGEASRPKLEVRKVRDRHASGFRKRILPRDLLDTELANRRNVEAHALRVVPLL